MFELWLFSVQDHLRWPCALTPFPRILEKFITPIIVSVNHKADSWWSTLNNREHDHMFVVHGMPSKLNLHGAIVTVGCCVCISFNSAFSPLTYYLQISVCIALPFKLSHAYGPLLCWWCTPTNISNPQCHDYCSSSNNLMNGFVFTFETFIKAYALYICTTMNRWHKWVAFDPLLCIRKCIPVMWTDARRGILNGSMFL
jgi:hypothetical protein